MRLALLAPLPPLQNGIADYAQAWMTAVRGAGVEVVVPPQREGQWDTADAGFWQGIDGVHAELGGGRGPEFVALEQLRARFPRLPLSATVHDPERLIWRSPSPPRGLGRWLAAAPRPLPQLLALSQDRRTLARERALARQLDAVVTLTRTGGQVLVERMQVAADKVHFIAHGNGVFAPQPLPEATPLQLLYFGFIYPGKGIEDLLDALALVRRQRPEAAVRLTMAGGSAPELAFGSRGDYVAELRERAQRLGIGDWIQWRLDLPAAQIVSCVQDHHVMLLPYRDSKKLALLGRMRGTSGALSWANACGRGVIASDARAFAEEVSHGNGVVFAQGDPAALAGRIIALVDAPAQASAWAAGAAALGQQRQWPRIAAQFAALFASLQESGR
ncbi:glycosyltransferase [Stenotrophomonas sp. STM01]|uniref:glycosyltransferase n=1 Tax=Stenotrophomonas sp. STM01 TaxID=2769278 RepID=UPI00178186A2|nr:glycosyltransferase [Stenotrophomonas sp. STM01]MBD9535498.1 glycosyltransferase [Stenotrophomonas sp. STM01]